MVTTIGHLILIFESLQFFWGGNEARLNFCRHHTTICGTKGFDVYNSISTRIIQALWIDLILRFSKDWKAIWASQEQGFQSRERFFSLPLWTGPVANIYCFQGFWDSEPRHISNCQSALAMRSVWLQSHKKRSLPSHYLFLLASECLSSRQTPARGWLLCGTISKLHLSKRAWGHLDKWLAVGIFKEKEGYKQETVTSFLHPSSQRSVFDHGDWDKTQGFIFGKGKAFSKAHDF